MKMTSKTQKRIATPPLYATLVGNLHAPFTLHLAFPATVAEFGP